MSFVQTTIDTLKTAKKTCFECGKKHGDYCGRNTELFKDTCDICGQQTMVTDAANFGFFYRGLCRLRIHRAGIERGARARSKSA